MSKAAQVPPTTATRSSVGAPTRAPWQAIPPRPFVAGTPTSTLPAPRMVGTAPSLAAMPPASDVVPAPAPSLAVSAVDAGSVRVPLAPLVPTLTTPEEPIPAPPTSGVAVRSRAVRATPASSTRPLVILADRNVGYRVRLAERLREFCDVEEVEDERAACDLCADGRPPALVVTDVTLRDSDGCDLARALRRESTLAKVPLLFLSTQPTATEVLNGVRVGARAHLAKEDGLRSVATRIRRVIQG